jgi:hypothetical protein
MHKRDFFLQALASGAYRYKRWVIEAFSVTRNSKPWPGGDGVVAFALHRNEEGKPFVYIGQDEVVTYLEGCLPNEPAFHFREEVVVGVGDLPNIKAPITTTYGNLLVNQLCLVYPFGDKIDYMEGKISPGRIEKIIEQRLRDNPKDGKERDPRFIYVDEYRKYNEAIFSLAGYTQLCVPSASAKTMTTDPRIAVRRKELLDEYRDQLHDPVIQAKIGNELIAMDKAWIKGDSSEGFFIKSKSFDVVRKKLFLFQGKESGFGSDSPFIETSLADGWDIDNLPAMGNALRDGSYNRGAQTALGGEATKFNYRIFQNTVVEGLDCGTKMGLPVIIEKDKASFYVSSSIITPTGLVELTEENVNQYVDKKVLLRSPAYCKTPGINFCATCMGKRIAETPTAISTYAADVGSIFLSTFMASMHGKALVTAKYDLKSRIT